MYEPEIAMRGQWKRQSYLVICLSLQLSYVTPVMSLVDEIIVSSWNVISKVAIIIIDRIHRDIRCRTFNVGLDFPDS